jgi:cobalamin-dependent methionine synthase I
LADAYSEGDDIIVDNRIRIPFLRQQQVGKLGYTLCLSDFIKEYSSEQVGRDITNTIGMFATTVSPPTNAQLSTFNLQLSTLSDRLAEATAEKMHEEVRKHYWGYAKDECLTMRELHEERFQGIRPAVGYPSLPDQSINHLIDRLLTLTDIGITLSENGAMNPPCSVSGFMFAHSKARYFAVGSISDEQLTDYAHRRDIPRQQAAKFLAALIGHQDHTGEGF